MDPISAALKKASRPVDMDLPDGWFWAKSNTFHGYFLHHSKNSYFYFFFGREISDNEPAAIKQMVYDIIQKAPVIVGG